MKKLNDIIPLIDIIFTQDFTFNFVTYKELAINFSKKGIKSKDKFMPKTPLNLFYDSYSLLNRYIKNNLIIKKEEIDEVLYNILSLLFYFKIPLIGKKWIENYKSQKRFKIPEQDDSKKNEQKIEKTEEEIREIKEIEELNEVIIIIIAILVDLIDVIQKKFK